MIELNERELLLLAYLEGELSGAEKARAEAIMAEDMAMQHEYRQLQNTVLKPEIATVYPNKSKLKRTVAKQKAPLGYILWPLAIAASFALLIVFYQPNAGITNGNSTALNTTANNNTTNNNTNTTAPKINETEAIVSPAQATYATSNPAQLPQVKNDNIQNNINAKITGEKQTMSAPLLAALPVNLPTVEKPALGVANSVSLFLPPIPRYKTPVQEEKRGWLAKTGQKVNQLLGYLQKPQLSIDKQENETGKEYWAITLETEKYEVEGRLYTRR
jgi:hypothetical protein